MKKIMLACMMVLALLVVPFGFAGCTIGGAGEGTEKAVIGTWSFSYVEVEANPTVVDQETIDGLETTYGLMFQSFTYEFNENHEGVVRASVFGQANETDFSWSVGEEDLITVSVEGEEDKLFTCADNKLIFVADQTSGPYVVFIVFEK